MKIINTRGELNTGKLRHFNIEYCFKFDEWAGFEIGEGEFFMEDKEALMNHSNADFFIKSIEVREKVFQTTIFPNEKLSVEKLNYQEQELKNTYTKAYTYETDIKSVEGWLIENRKIGLWEIYEDFKHFIDVEMDNFIWYYLEAYKSGKMIRETETKKHPLYMELMNLEENSFAFSI